MLNVNDVVYIFSINMPMLRHEKAHFQHGRPAETSLTTPSLFRPPEISPQLVIKIKSSCHEDVLGSGGISIHNMALFGDE